MGGVDDQWSWNTFLEPLDNLSDFNPPASCNKNVDPVASPCSLVQKVVNHLREQDIETRKRREEEERDAEACIMRELGKLCGGYLPEEKQFMFKEFKALFKEYEGAQQKKSDRMKSGSTWTVDMLKEYVQYEDVRFVPKPKYKPKLIDDKIITEIIEKQHPKSSAGQQQWVHLLNFFNTGFVLGMWFFTFSDRQVLGARCIEICILRSGKHAESNRRVMDGHGSLLSTKKVCRCCFMRL